MYTCVCVYVAYELQVLQVDVLVAEAIEAYRLGELQPEVLFYFNDINVTYHCDSTEFDYRFRYY